MSVKVVAILNPFKAERTEQFMEVDSLENIYKKISPLLPIEYAHFQINDEPVMDISRIPQEGDEVIIRVLPAGSNPVETGGKIEGWLGVASAIAGVVSLFIPGVGVVLGAGLIIGGISTAISGFTIAGLSNQLATQGEIEEKPKADPQIRGSKNTAKPWGAIPIVLGKHLITPPFASKPYTDITENKQYLRQLFAIGYNQINISEMRIGETLLSQYTEVQTEIISDGRLSTIVPVQVSEITINQQLKFNEPVTKTTNSDVDQISVDIVFPNGLVRFDDDGNPNDYTVLIGAYFKPTSMPDSPYYVLGYFGPDNCNVTGNSISTIRKVITRTILPGESGYSADKQYDIRLIRLNDQYNASNVVDQAYWGSLRGIRFKDSVAPEIRSKICTIGIRIKATDQLNGVIDQFNCVVESVVPDYIGSGTGPAKWVNNATSNPSSLFLWILRGPMNPRPVSDYSIDWSSLEMWHQWCKIADHTCNAIIDNQITVKEMLDKICSTGRASLAMRDGKYTVILDVEKVVPIQLFTPRNSWGFAGAKYFSERPHGLKISFIDAERGWQPNERIVYDDGYNEDGSDGKLKADKFQKLSFWGVTNDKQIWKDGRYQIAVTRLRPETFSLNCDIENLVCTRGDLVRIAHDVPLLGLYSGRIKELYRDSNNNIVSITVDELIRMVDGMSYGIRIRKSNGTNCVQPVTTIHGETNFLTFQTPLLPEENIAVGDLYSFGYNNLETVEMIITGIEARKDLTATLYLIPAAPGVHQADQGDIPEYNSAISIPGDFSNQLNINPIMDYTSIVNTLQNSAAQNAQIGNILNQLQSIPTANELIYGNTKGDWTETPEKPTIECIPLGNNMIMRIKKQYNLSNFLHYAIRISKDQLNWYSLFLGGTGADWKDQPNEYTPWEVELFVHSKLPLGGTVEDPQPETYYYQVAVVTRKMVMSPLSDIAAVTVSPIQNGDIAANFIAANKLLTGDIVTLLLQAAYAIIGYRGDGTYESPHAGDRRTGLYGDEIQIGAEFIKEYWSMINGIRLGGTLMGVFLAMIGCKGIYHPDNPPESIEFFPNYSYQVYTFDGNYADQYGVDDWNTKTNVAFSSNQKKFGSSSLYAPASEYSESYIEKNTYGTIGNDQSVGVWVYIERYTGANIPIMRFWNSGPAPEYYQDNILIDISYGKAVFMILRGSTDKSVALDITYNAWHFLAFSYKKADQTLYCVCDNKVASVVSAGEWFQTGNFKFRLYPRNTTGVFTTSIYIDEACLAMDQFVNPDVWAQHFIHNLPWNTKYSASDVRLRCGSGGMIRFDTMQAMPTAGLPHFTGLINIKNMMNVTSAIIEIDLKDYIPHGATAVDLQIVSNVSAAFIAYVSPSSSVFPPDDVISNYSNSPGIPDHISTRVTNRKFWMRAIVGSGTVSIALIKFYIG